MELKERIKRPPLKTQLMDHYRQKNFTVSKSDVQSSASTAGIAMYWAITLLLLYETLFIIVPDLYKGDHDKQFLVKILIWLTFLVSTLNWCAIKQAFGNNVRADDKTKYFDDCLQQVTPSGWTNCPKCQVSLRDILYSPSQHSLFSSFSHLLVHVRSKSRETTILGLGPY